MTAFALLADLCADPRRINGLTVLTSVQRAKLTVSRRLGRDLTHTRLIDLPADLRDHITRLARQYRSIPA